MPLLDPKGERTKESISIGIRWTSKVGEQMTDEKKLCGNCYYFDKDDPKDKYGDCLYPEPERLPISMAVQVESMHEWDLADKCVGWRPKV